jgi:dienelactone hydrolase
MHVLNHFPERVDAANLLRRQVAGDVYRAVESGRRQRESARTPEAWSELRERWLALVRAEFPPELFAMREEPVRARTLARHQRDGYVIETVLFTSLWGWEANAHLCLPDGPGPWPAIVCPTGHSAKTGPDYQLPPVVFAKNGFAAITFDSPWQGEKGPGNDHFHQGVACLLTGLWTETFFVMDALRAIDYLADRPDIDISRGVGMTGVSGGGQTTMVCALLDERVRCIAPVCCTGAQALIGARDLYTSCPEVFGPGLLAAGIDLPEKLALAAPTPCLVVSGAGDELYTPEVVDAMVDDVRPVYDLLGAGERFAHFRQEDSGHAYTPLMAERVVEWMARWLCGRELTAEPLANPAGALEPAEVINCRPNTARNMQAINSDRAAALAERRPPATRDGLRTLLALPAEIPVPEAILAGHEMSWQHRLERVALRTSPELWAPGLLMLDTRRTAPAPALLWIDDRGKWTAFEREEWISTAAGFLQRGAEGMAHVFSLDARGWGETAPEHVAYDLAGWNDITRILSYLSIALGEPLLGGKARDVLAALAWLRARPEIDPARILIGGHGAGALAALFAGVLDGKVAGFIGTEMLASYQSLTGPEGFAWPHDIFVPGLLACGDIVDFLCLLPCPALAINPVDHLQRPIAGHCFPENVTVLPTNEGGKTVEWIRHALSSSP